MLSKEAVRSNRYRSGVKASDKGFGSVGSGLKAQVYMVTPTHAERLLANNDSNRAVSQRTVNAYAAIMGAGDWALNGESIIVNGDGTLLDGQHRLLACVQSGKSFPSLIVEGVGKETFVTVDSGKTRSLADAMCIEGIPNYTAAAATARCLVAYKQRGTPDTRGLTNLGFSKRHFIDVYRNEADLIQRGISQANRLRGKMQISKAAVAFSFVTFASVYDEDLAADFFAGVYDGRGLDKRDPCYVLRERLYRIGSAVQYEMTPVEQAAAMFKAFRAFAHNVEIGPRQLTWRRYGPTAEAFPEV